MNYLILTIKTKVQMTCGEVDQIGYLCVNGINRCLDTDGKTDVLTFVISGTAGKVPVSSVICITPATPNYTQLEALK